MFFLSTDTEKAFDGELELHVCGPSAAGHQRKGDSVDFQCVHYSKVLFKMNAMFSEPIAISNGTHQGFPLSPLLFALTLKPFLSRVGLNENITGLWLGASHCKVSTYVDNMLFSLTNPLVFLPNLLQGFWQYGAFSNLKINLSKSEVMRVWVPSTQLHNLQLSFKFKWTSFSLKYFGTRIPLVLTNAFALNFPHLLSAVHNLLDKWHQGLHSWFGCCNIV